MVLEGKTKTTFDLAVAVKHRLATLKADFRAKNLPATESVIVEMLIEGADVKILEQRLAKLKRMNKLKRQASR